MGRDKPGDVNAYNEAVLGALAEGGINLGQASAWQHRLDLANPPGVPVPTPVAPPLVNPYENMDDQKLIEKLKASGVPDKQIRQMFLHLKPEGR